MQLPGAARALPGAGLLAVTGLAGGCLLVAGCGGTPPSRSAVKISEQKVTPCGEAHTPAGVPVHIQVRKGHVSCSTALLVERDYTQAVAAGHAPGNGGGGPVRVHGWTCHGYSTPVVLKTGNASSCVLGSTQIMAVLATG